MPIDDTQPQITPPSPGDLGATVAQPVDALETGAVVIPGYDLMPEIARGGMGVVYRARDRAFDREVAVKVMLPGMNAAEFVREARITGRLPHPGIPPVYALGTLPDGRPFLAMKLIKGDTLDKVLKARADLRADRAALLAVFEQISQAVGYAHAQGIVHRDLKPSNVMVGAFGEVQVMDWGLAKELRSAEPEPAPPAAPATVAPEDIAATVAGAIKGTPAYMAPEQARGEPVDARADVFALGGILAATLTGHPPFAGDSVLGTIVRAARAELGDTFARLDDCGADAELKALAKRCLAARADDRPADASELASAVAAYRAEVEERLRRAEREHAARAAKAEEQRKRRRVQWALAAAVLLLAGMGAFGAVIASLWRTAEANRAEAVTQKDAADQAAGEALDQKGIANAQRDAAERAKGEALTQKVIADRAKGEAEKAQQGEADARKAVEREREKLAVFEYGRAMQVAHQEWRDNNVAAARVLLDGTRRELRGWEWHYLDRICDSSLFTLKGTGGMRSAEFSPDGTHIVTVDEGNVTVWDAGTATERFTIKMRPAFVGRASFSPDGTRVVVGSITTGHKGATIQIWAAKTGVEMHRFETTASNAYSAAFSPDGARIVTASYDGTARVWDAQTGAELLTIKGHTGAVFGASFSPDGSRVVTAGEDKTARVWDAKTGAELLTLKGHLQNLLTASFSPDGTRIVTASHDGTAGIWDAKSGTELLVLAGNKSGVTAAAFSRDGTRVVTGGYEGTTKVWSARTGAALVAHRGHSKGVQTAAFSPDGTRIVTASSDGTAKVWDAMARAEAQVLDRLPAELRDTSYSPDGTRFVKGGEWAKADVIDVRTKAVLFTLKAGAGHMKGSFSADASRIVTCSFSLTANVWDAKTGAQLLALDGRGRGIHSATFSPDNTRIITTDTDGTAKIWDAKSGAELSTLKGHTNSVFTGAISPDAGRAVTADSDGVVKVWDTKTGAELLTLTVPGGLFQPAFSSDGKRIVATGRSGGVWMWDSRPFRDRRSPDPVSGVPRP